MSSTLKAGNGYKVTPSETDITDVDDEHEHADELADNADLRQFTRDELTAFDGQTTGQPIYIAVLGNVYDVSSGSKFYGPGNQSLCTSPSRNRTMHCTVR